MRRRDFLIAASASLVAASDPASARLVKKFAEELKNGEFNWFPERSATGPIIVIVSIPDQRVHVYRNGIRIAASSCSTGKKGHATPTGVFTILQKDKDHHSATYDDAAMPNMNRLTWDGIALHAGNLPGYPASHGCVRLPMDFSERLFEVTRLGMTVVIADQTSFPDSVVHPGLVLGDDVVGRYKAAEASILKREYSARRAPKAQQTSVIVSSADRTVTVLENGAKVATGTVAVDGKRRKIGDKLFTLAGMDGQKSKTHWLRNDVRPQTDLASNDIAEPASIRLDSKIRDEISRRAHLGMNVLFTDQPADSKSRTQADFRILTT